MNSQSECRNNCWLIAGVVGLLVLIILWLIAGVGFFGALMWAIIVGLMVGFVLPFFRCVEDDAARAPAPGAEAGSGAVVEDAEEQRQQAEAAAKEQRAADARAARMAADAKADEAEAARRADEEAAASRQADADAARAAEDEAAGRNDAEAERQANADAARQAEVPEPAAAPAAPADHGGGGEGTRPPALSEARGGAADDLKKIKGVGPKLEGDLNALGFYHYDQIAAWSAGEVAWADENLGGIAGRVSRDGWVEQACLLAGGGETAFSRKVDEGDVY